MPSLVQSYDVLLDLVNDMQDSVSIQLLRDYGRTNDRVVLLNPTESVTLVLESGSPYQYAVKSRTRVASVTYVISTSSSINILLIPLDVLRIPSFCVCV